MCVHSLHQGRSESLPGLFSEYLAAGAIILAYCFDKNVMLPRKRFVNNTVVGMSAVFLVTSTPAYWQRKLVSRQLVVSAEAEDDVTLRVIFPGLRGRL